MRTYHVCLLSVQVFEIKICNLVSLFFFSLLFHNSGSFFFPVPASHSQISCTLCTEPQSIYADAILFEHRKYITSELVIFEHNNDRSSKSVFYHFHAFFSCVSWWVRQQWNWKAKREISSDTEVHTYTQRLNQYNSKFKKKIK